MTNSFTWLRVEAARRGLRFRQIADGAKIDYQVFTQVINGYAKQKPDFERKIKRYFAKLETGGISE